MQWDFPRGKTVGDDEGVLVDGHQQRQYVDALLGRHLLHAGAQSVREGLSIRCVLSGLRVGLQQQPHHLHTGVEG